jgi:hypothetical protein
MKKRFLFILALGAVVALSTSCAKKCVCVYYENDKKIIQTNSKEDGQKYFKDGQNACEGAVPDNQQRELGRGNWINTKGHSILPGVTGEIKTEQKCKLQ